MNEGARDRLPATPGAQKFQEVLTNQFWLFDVGTVTAIRQHRCLSLRYLPCDESGVSLEA